MIITSDNEYKVYDLSGQEVTDKVYDHDIFIRKQLDGELEDISSNLIGNYNGYIIQKSNAIRELGPLSMFCYYDFDNNGCYDAIAAGYKDNRIYLLTDDDIVDISDRVSNER